MRWLSALLVFCLSYAFAHEAVCHGGALDILSKCFSHVGSQHVDDCHIHTDHNHQPPQTNHDCDYHDCDGHDCDGHDHPLKTLLAKKDPSSRRRILLNQAGAVAHLMPGSARLAVVFLRHHSAIPGAESSVPGYLCAHVLRL